MGAQKEYNWDEKRWGRKNQLLWYCWSSVTVVVVVVNSSSILLKPMAGSKYWIPGGEDEFRLQQVTNSMEYSGQNMNAAYGMDTEAGIMKITFRLSTC